MTLRQVAAVVGLAFFGTLALTLSDLSNIDKPSIVYDLTHRDKIDMVIMAEPHLAMALYWREEVSKRYSDAVMVVAHGNTGPDGYWWALDQSTGITHPWSELIKEIRLKHPYRRIVIISCNPGHLHLHATNVTYPTESVWFFPDEIMRNPLGKVYNDPALGDINSFVEQ